MRILIADDEQIVLDGLANIILHYNPSFSLRAAKSGREAIQIAETFHPDVVFMDIKMPGISGLEALEEIHRQLPQAILVVLSAYEQFEFARSAIRLQVLEYLVKPVYKDRFLEVLKRIERLLEERKNERQNVLELREKYQKLIPFFEQDLVFRIISGTDTEESLSIYRDLLNLPKGLCAMMLLQIELNPQDSGYDRWGSEYRIHQHLVRLSEEIRLNFSCLTGPVSTNPLTILVPLKGSDEYQARLDSVAIAESILKRAPAGVTAAIGIGKAYEFPSGLSRSYQEALLALGMNQHGPIRNYMDLFGTEQPDWEVRFQEVESDILDAVNQGLPERIKDICAKNLPVLLRLPSEADLNKLLQRLWELEILALREARKYGFKGESSVAPVFPGCVSRENLLQSYCPKLQGLLTTCALFIRENKTCRLNSIVGSAKAFIDRRYMDEALNLEEVARWVSVTPYYLSRLFRAEMGMTFTEYLTKIRLEKAVELLQEGCMVKEICFRVGYGDPNYFSRLFRKVYGVSPTEFRKGS